MISHVILHYNRPWLLETHINLVRKFFPSVSQIIVADDGSDPDVISHIKKMPIDNIFTNKDHLCEWEKGSCSDTIQAGFGMAKNKFVSFSEDDFFPWPSGIDDKDFYQNGTFPDIKLSHGPDVMRESLDLLFERKCNMVQMARDSGGWKPVPVTKKQIKTESITWEQMCHKKKPKFYYCNWPWIARKEILKMIKIPKRTSMWILEPKLAKEFDSLFGLVNWSFCPDVRRFVHVGLPFSKKNLSFSEHTEKSGIRNAQAMRFAEESLSEKLFSNIDNMNVVLMEKWKQKPSCISIESMSTLGLRKSFNNWFQETII